MAYRINRNAHRPRKVSEKAPMKVRIARFLERQGFYVILLVCLGIVGITAYLTLSAPSEEPQTQQVENVDWPNLAQSPNESASQDEETLDELFASTPTPAPATFTPAPTLAATPTPRLTPKPTQQASGGQGSGGQDSVDQGSGEQSASAQGADALGQEAGEQAADAAATPEPQDMPVIAQIDGEPDPTPTPKPNKSSKLAFSSPVVGTLSVKFADKNLVYNKTLKQWTTHPAIDIAAKEGTPVKAVLGGKVEFAGKDAMLGYKVVIEHDDGMTSVYANLSDDGGFKKGQAVSAGDTVGKVGKTAISEIEDAPHLHFAFLQKGKALNPETLIENLTRGLPESE